MKTLLSEKRTQVYFPLATYRRIARTAKRKSKSSAQVIREAVDLYLEKDEKEKEIDWENDPIFKAAGFIKSSGVTDSSINHDHYLYGSPRKEVRPKKK